MVAVIASFDEIPAEIGCSLAELTPGRTARVIALEAAADVPAEFMRRLEDLGFLPGEHLRVVARGPFGKEPIAVRIGTAMFALRLAEARCVLVTHDE